jgi:hypothetical protein
MVGEKALGASEKIFSTETEAVYQHQAMKFTATEPVCL